MTTLVTMLLKQLHMRIYFYFANIDASFMNEGGLGFSVLKLIFGTYFFSNFGGNHSGKWQNMKQLSKSFFLEYVFQYFFFFHFPTIDLS